MRNVLAIRVPAECGFNCANCRSPAHNQGDADAVFAASVREIASGKYKQAYITSDGDTSRYVRYAELVAALAHSVDVTVLSMTQQACIKGLLWIEISLHHSKDAVHKAVARARANKIVPILAIVWDGIGVKPDLESLADEFGVDAVLMRMQCVEGRAAHSGGASEVYRRLGANLNGWNPIAAYDGMDGIGAVMPLKCIDTYGNVVDRFRGNSERPH